MATPPLAAVLLGFLALLAFPAVAEIRETVIADPRTIIPLDEFRFSHQGVLELNVIAFDPPASSDLDLSQFGFFLSTLDAWVHVLRQLQDLDVTCALQSDLVKLAYSFDRLKPVPNPAGVKVARSSSFTTAFRVSEPGQYTLVFANCLTGGTTAALFLLFRPRPLDIAVSEVRLPSFAAANGTVAFTFEQLATVRNPNRAPLAHFDSSLRIAYAGGEIGSIYIPAGLIDSGSTKHLTASFAVQAFPAATPPPLQMAAQQPAAAAVVMEVDSLLVVKGRVKMLGVLTHKVQASKMCRVGVSPMDGRVLGFRC